MREAIGILRKQTPEVLFDKVLPQTDSFEKDKYTVEAVNVPTSILVDRQRKGEQDTSPLIPTSAKKIKFKRKNVKDAAQLENRAAQSDELKEEVCSPGRGIDLKKTKKKRSVKEQLKDPLSKRGLQKGRR